MLAAILTVTLYGENILERIWNRTFGNGFFVGSSRHRLVHARCMDPRWIKEKHEKLGVGISGGMGCVPPLVDASEAE